LHGDLIGWVIQEDWQVFSERLVAQEVVDDIATALLTAGLRPDEALDEPDFDGGLFRRPRRRLSDDWVEAVDQLLEGNLDGGVGARFEGPDGRFAPHPLAAALEDMAVRIGEGTEVFRARIYEERGQDSRFSVEEMGAPPPGEASEIGRANRRGEPVLYTASDPETAIAEKRVWAGAAVAVARIRIGSDLWLANVHTPEPIESPFGQEHLAWRLELDEVLRRFGEELSRPVLPGEEEVLYRASQTLCEFIEESGYDGVIYPSALGPGHNIVCFDVDAGEVVDREDHRIQAVRHEERVLDPAEPLYRRTPYDHHLEPNTE
jgi:RES domain-containing protein